MGSLIKELPRFEKHDRSCMLKERLRQALIDQAETGTTTTTKSWPIASNLNRRRQFTALVRHSRPS